MAIVIFRQYNDNLDRVRANLYVELQAGRLRQGWGYVGNGTSMALRNAQGDPIPEAALHQSGLVRRSNRLPAFAARHSRTAVFASGAGAETHEVADGLNVDLDDGGEVVGFRHRPRVESVSTSRRWKSKRCRSASPKQVESRDMNSPVFQGRKIGVD